MAKRTTAHMKPEPKFGVASVAHQATLHTKEEFLAQLAERDELNREANRPTLDRIAAKVYGTKKPKAKLPLEDDRPPMPEAIDTAAVYAKFNSSKRSS